MHWTGMTTPSIQYKYNTFVRVCTLFEGSPSFNGLVTPCIMEIERMLIDNQAESQHKHKEITGRLLCDFNQIQTNRNFKLMHKICMWDERKCGFLEVRKHWTPIMYLVDCS